MTPKEKIESNPEITPLAKLIARVVAEYPADTELSASDVGSRVAHRAADVSEACHELRRAGVFITRQGDVTLPLARIIMHETFRRAYAPATGAK